MVAIETDTKKLFNSAGELATGFVLLRLPAELETGDGLMLTTRGRWAVKAGVFVDGATKTLPAGAEVEIVHVFNVDDDSGRGVRKDRTTRWVEVPAGTTLEYVDLITDHVTVPPAAGPGVPAWAAELLEAIGDMETLTDTTMTAVAADEDSAFSVQQRATFAPVLRANTKSRCVADGSTDNRALVQAEIDALAELGGGVLEFPAGDIMVRSQLYVRSNVTLYSAGGTFFICDVNISSGLFVVDPSGGDVENIAWDGVGFRGGAVDDVTEPRRSRTYTNSFDNAILIRGADGTTPTQPVVRNARAVNVRCINVESLPVFFDGVQGEARITDSYFENCLDVGFTFNESVVFSNNYIRKSADNGVSISRGNARVTCVGNNIDGSAFNGIWLAGWDVAAGPVTGVISGNTVTDSGLVGITAKDAPQSLIITGNVIDGVRRGPVDEPNDNAGIGIKVSGYPDLTPPYTINAKKVRVSNNLILNAQRAGVQVRGGAENVDVHDNTIIDAGTQFKADGSTAILSTDTDQNYGVGVSAAYSTTVTGLSIRNNSVIDTRGTPYTNYDVLVGSSPSADVVGNRAVNLRNAGKPDSILYARGDTLWVPAAQFVAAGVGTPALSASQRWPIWLLDAASSEIVAAVVRVPANWLTFTAAAHWVNAGAGSGNVVLRMDRTTRGVGETLAVPGAGAPVTSTAGAQDVVVSTTLGSSLPMDSTEDAVFQLVRVGGDAADTLANDIGVLGVLLTRQT